MKDMKDPRVDFLPNGSHWIGGVFGRTIAVLMVGAITAALASGV